MNGGVYLNKKLFQKDWIDKGVIYYGQTRKWK